MTLRLKIINEKNWLNQLEKGRPILLCAWHQQFFAVIRYFKRYKKFNPALMISQSRDGDLIAFVADRSGWHTARGSSSRGGKSAMNDMIRHLEQHGLGAHIVDGPTGPIGKVKPGAIQIARKADALVVPFYIHADHAWFFHSWDRFMLPKPFSKVSLIFGNSMYFSAEDKHNDFEAHRRLLESTMKPGLVVE